MSEERQGAIRAHLPCPDCNSSDALAEYIDHTYCFACFTHTWKDDAPPPKGAPQVSSHDFVHGNIGPIPARGLTAATCKRYRYEQAVKNGKTVQVANYYDDKGNVVAQKLRFPDKTFPWIGEPKKAPLFGQHLYHKGGKMLVITEGEIDAMSVSQALPSWPAVSIQNGAGAAAKSIKDQYEYIVSFKKIVLWFDMDKQGREAVDAVAQLLPMDRVHVVKSHLKDANEYVKAGRQDEIYGLVFGAEQWRPVGCVTMLELRDRVMNAKPVPSVPYPFPSLNEYLNGMRRGELVMITAGTGVGKSTMMREMVHNLASHGERIAGAFLEERPERTSLGLVGISLNLDLARMPRSMWPDADVSREYERLHKSVLLHDGFGSVDADRLENMIRYYAKARDCGWFFLDHLSMLVSGAEVDDERKFIDLLMTRLRCLVEELHIGMVAAAHTRRPTGNDGYEEGMRLSLSALRGSGSIAQLSDVVLGVNRVKNKDTGEYSTQLTVLKNRPFGTLCRSGIDLAYSSETGRLIERPIQV